MQTRSDKEPIIKPRFIPIVWRLEQYGLGMTVQALPSIEYFKKHKKNDLYLKAHKKHIDFLKYFVDENKLYPWIRKSKNGILESATIFESTDHEEYNLSNCNIPPYACHAVDHYLQTSCGIVSQDLSIKNYPKFPVEKVDISKFNLPKKYVTIGPAWTKNTCVIPTNIINDIIDECKNKNYDVIILGDIYEKMVKKLNMGPKLNEGIHLDKCINLLNKTTLPEMIKVLSNSHVYIGPEGGLMNFAGLTDVPMIISHTSMNPETRVPYRHNKLGWEVYNVIADVECRYCITNSIHTKIDMNYMNDCMYNDFKCLDTITFDKFKTYLDNIL